MVSRRRLLRGGATAAAGAAAAVAALKLPALFGPDRLPIDGGYAPAGNAESWSPRGGVETIWHVKTDKPWVALTFDDGPAPDWTPKVLDALDRTSATATFFLVGENLRKYADLVKGRYDHHEVGNHTWAHKDLAQRDEQGVRDQLQRCHDAIREVLGRTPRVMRPPWGHLAGTTLTVADQMDYDVVMWSQRMREDVFAGNPPGIVEDTVSAAKPGAIILAHDTGPADRLVTIDNLDGIVNGLRAKGLELVTVSDLIASGR